MGMHASVTATRDRLYIQLMILDPGATSPSSIDLQMLRSICLKMSKLSMTCSLALSCNSIHMHVHKEQHSILEYCSLHINVQTQRREIGFASQYLQIKAWLSYLRSGHNSRLRSAVGSGSGSSRRAARVTLSPLHKHHVIQKICKNVLKNYI